MTEPVIVESTMPFRDERSHMTYVHVVMMLRLLYIYSR